MKSTQQLLVNGADNLNAQRVDEGAPRHRRCRALARALHGKVTRQQSVSEYCYLCVSKLFFHPALRASPRPAFASEPTAWRETMAGEGKRLTLDSSTRARCVSIARSLLFAETVLSTQTSHQPQHQSRLQLASGVDNCNHQLLVLLTPA